MKIPFRIFFIAVCLLLCFIFYAFGLLQKQKAEMMISECQEIVEENLELQERIKELEASIAQ